MTLRQFVKEYYDKEQPKRTIYNKDYTKKSAEIMKKKIGKTWKIGASPYEKNRYIVYKTEKKEPFETYYKKYKKELEIIYKQTLSRR